MALPVINETPKYKLTIPSTGQKVTFRPFLVKEQKVLLMAMESNDKEQVIMSITDTLQSCIDETLNLSALATFDIEYMFTQIRAKSVGESADIILKCSECETGNEIKVILSDIQVDAKPIDKLDPIKLNDKFTIKLKYPDYERMRKVMVNDEPTVTDALFQLAIGSLDKLLSEDEQIDMREESEEELATFLDNLNSEQFEKIMEFVRNLPKLRKEIEFDCSDCAHHNKVTLEGLDDFF